MTLLQKPPTSRKGEPVWEIASLYPNQATSRLLDGFAVAVDDVFAAAEK
jgi:hypothetical protein